MVPIPGWGKGGNWRPGTSEFVLFSGQQGVSTPPSRLPRQVRRAVRDRSIAEVILLGQPVLGFAPNNNPLVPGQRTLTLNTGAISTAGDGAGLHFQRLRRSGGGSKERWFLDGGPAPFNHIVDPNGAQAGWSVILSDLIVPTFDSGHAWVYFGLGGHSTATDETSKYGAWWHANDVDLCWTSGLYGGTGTPSTTIHETKQTGLTFAATGVTQARRLSIEFEAVTKTINWYADGVLVDSYKPAATLLQTGACPHLLYYGITAAGADCSIYHYGGGNPRILTLVPVD